MTDDKQLIEKLNDGLVQLIDAYEKLQKKYEELEEKLAQEKAKNADLEYKLSEFNEKEELQTTKMDSMLSKIQNLLKSDKKEETIEIEETREINKSKEEINETSSILDIKLDTDEDEQLNTTTSSPKIDLGRMETLLNGLNNR